MVPHIDYVLRECVECLKQRLTEQSRPPFLRLTDFKEQLRAEINAWNEKPTLSSDLHGGGEVTRGAPVPPRGSSSKRRHARAHAAVKAHELSEPGRLDRMVEDIKVLTTSVFCPAFAWVIPI